MILHDGQSLCTSPVPVVLLTIRRHPLGLLHVPHQTMTTYRHLVTLGITDQIVCCPVAELTTIGLQRFHLHLVFGCQQSELVPDFLSLCQILIGDIGLPR